MRESMRRAAMLEGGHRVDGVASLLKKIVDEISRAPWTA